MHIRCSDLHACSRLVTQTYWKHSQHISMEISNGSQTIHLKTRSVNDPTCPSHYRFSFKELKPSGLCKRIAIILSTAPCVLPSLHFRPAAFANVFGIQHFQELIAYVPTNANKKMALHWLLHNYRIQQWCRIWRMELWRYGGLSHSPKYQMLKLLMETAALKWRGGRTQKPPERWMKWLFFCRDLTVLSL